MIRQENGAYSVEPIPEYVKLGKYSSVAEGVIFHSLDQEHQWSVNHKCVYTYNWDQPREQGEIIIGNDVWIGNGARILPNIHIGNGAIIGAGAVVTKDVPPYAVIVGNPGKISKYRFSEEVIDKLEKIKWWDWEEKTIDSRKDDMKDIDLFLEKYL